jgi:hypothetical protein
MFIHVTYSGKNEFKFCKPRVLLKGYSPKTMK